VQQWSIGNYRYLTPLRQHCIADRSVAENYLCHFSRFSRSHLLPAAVFTAALVRIMSGGIYRHFSRYYLLPAAVFTAALASCFRKSWIRTVLHAVYNKVWRPRSPDAHPQGQQKRLLWNSLWWPSIWDLPCAASLAGIQTVRPRAQRTSPWKSPSGCPWYILT